MKEFVIENKYQKITILNYGATIHKWYAFSNKFNILISNLNKLDYLNPNNAYMGATIGRVANRIKDGLFTLNNKEYKLDLNFYPNSGHGGDQGFFRQKFEVVTHEKTYLKLKYNSLDNEAFYPGNLTLFVSYVLKDNSLEIIYEATSDKDTLLNVTNHSYFNLSNEANILNHTVKATSSSTLKTDNYLVPTGEIENNINNLLNLNNEKELKELIYNKEVLKKANGLDHFFLFDYKDSNLNEITLKYKNRSLIIKTTYPGFQMYTFQNEVKQPLLNRSYEKYIGVAFEPQFEPDAINHPHFSNIVLKENETYKEKIVYTLVED